MPHRSSKSRSILAVSAVAAAAMPALAHHSLGSVYERSRDTRLHGTVAEFRFVNPHPVLVIEVDDGDGGTVGWELEMDNRFELSRIGVTADTFEAGDLVFARGSAARAGGRALYVWRLDRPADGFWYEQRGSTPHVGRSSP